MTDLDLQRRAYLITAGALAGLAVVCVVALVALLVRGAQ